MRTSVIVRGLFCLAAAAVLMTPALSAQLCPDATDTFWKHDTVADDAPGNLPVGSAVITPFCNDEAAGSYFQLAPGSAPQFLKQVSVGYGHIAAAPLFQAVLNIEIYEGTVNFNPGSTVGMPPKVFDLQQDHGLTFNVTSTGISAYDLSQYNIVLEDNFVVAFRMLQNVSFPGCPSAGVGSDANLLTDGPGFCEPGKSLLDERNTGWVDPADWQFAPLQTICPTFYAGNWVIRACTTDAGTWQDLGGGTSGINGPVIATGSGPLTEGTFNPVGLTGAPPSALMIVWIALNPSAPFSAIGGTVHAFPFSSQILFFASPTGTFSAASAWPAGIPSGTNAWFQFIVDDPSVIWQITMSNALLATTP